METTAPPKIIRGDSISTEQLIEMLLNKTLTPYRTDINGCVWYQLAPVIHGVPDSPMEVRCDDSE